MTRRFTSEFNAVSAATIYETALRVIATMGPESKLDAAHLAKVCLMMVDQEIIPAFTTVRLNPPDEVGLASDTAKAVDDGGLT